MDHPLPHAIDFAEQMFMHYQDRIMRNQFKSIDEKNFCIAHANMYYHMWMNLYPWEKFIEDYDLPFEIVHPKNPLI